MKQIRRILICPDAHHPYSDEIAWNTFLAAAKKLRPDVLVIIGDFADCYSVSFHSKHPERKFGLKKEIEAVNIELNKLEKLKIPRVIYCLGNHEFRLERWLCDRAPELYGLISITELFRLKKRGWEVVPYKKSIKIGKIHFSHDVGRCGRHAASQSLTDYGHPLIIGHTHRAQVIYAGTVSGDRHVCMSVGWLGDFDSVDYRHRDMVEREWQHAFGLVDMTKDGLGWVNVIPIIKGRCVVDGFEVKA